MDPTKAQCAYSAASEALSALERGDMDGVAAAALKGANLQGLGLPPHIADPSSATAVQLPPGVAIDGAGALEGEEGGLACLGCWCDWQGGRRRKGCGRRVGVVLKQGRARGWLDMGRRDRV